MTLPVQGEAYQFYLTLVAEADPTTFLTDPTIEDGDFQISIDGSSLANLAVLPTVNPANSGLVNVTLTASEMDGEKINVVAIDQSGSEWQQAVATIDVPEGSEESNYNLLTGDHTETSTSAIIKKRGTTTELLNKTVSGSLLDPDVTITTVDT